MASMGDNSSAADGGSAYGAKGATDTDFRRKWDRDEYLRRAAERELAEKSGKKKDEGEVPPELRTHLKARDYKLMLDSKLNKTVVVSAGAPLSQQAGYYCEVCNSLMRDSVAFLDHINGKRHQRRLGMTMKVEQSSLDQVKDRLEALKRKKASGGEPVYDFKARVEKAEQEEEERKRLKRERTKERRRAGSSSGGEKTSKDAPDGSDGDEDDEGDDAGSAVDPAMAELMGFSDFGSTKK